MGIFQNIFGPIESTSAISSMNPLPGHPDNDSRPTLATHLLSDLTSLDINERDNNSQPKIKPQETPPEVRFIKTPRKNPRNNNLSRYGSWGYMMLGMLMCSIVLLMCGVWECIRRVQKNDVLEQFHNNTEPLENIAQARNDDNNCPQYEPPPPYSSLFPLAKDFNLATNSDISAPPSIYFTSSSATILPSAPSAPASINASLPLISSSRRSRSLTEPSSTQA